MQPIVRSIPCGASLRTLFIEADNLPPTSLTMDAVASVPENAPLGTFVGTLSGTDPNADVGDTLTFSLADDAGGRFGVAANGVDVIVTGVLDFESRPVETIVVRATDRGGLTLDKAFSIPITDVAEAPAAEPPPTNGTVVDDGTFINGPTVTSVNSGIKFSGKKPSGGSGKFIYDIGIPSAGDVYTITYDPDWSLLANQGKTAMVGFGFKNGNNFHLVGLKGDGGTGLHKAKVSGTQWSQPNGHTLNDGGAAANGTQDGPNSIQIAISGDGATYTLRSGVVGQSPTSYGNEGGSGDRRSLITVTGTVNTNGGGTFTQSNAQVWINGATNDTGGYFTAGQSGKYLNFDFGAGVRKIVTGIKLYQSDTSTHGVWKAQGSNDGSTYTDIGSTFTLGGAATQTITALSANTTGYQHLRLTQVSGTTSGTPWIYEFEFEIAEMGDLVFTGIDEFTAAVPSPLAGATSVTSFGVAVYLDAADAGNFAVAISLWRKGYNFAAETSTLWLKPETLGADASAVSSWLDSSSVGGRNATQATANRRPVVVANALNGYKAVQFGAGDGNPDWLEFATAGFFSTADGASVYIVAKNDLDPPSTNTGALIQADNHGGSDHTPYSDATIYSGFGSTVRNTVGNPVPSLASWYILSFHSSPNLWECYLNGTLLFSTTSNSVAFQALARIGANASGTSWSGKIVEMRGLPLHSGPRQRQRNEGDLAWKFGLLNILPANHPWKVKPPNAPVPAARVAQAFVDVLTQSPAPPARVAQTFADVLTQSPTPPARVAQVYLEVLTQ